MSRTDRAQAEIQCQLPENETVLAIAPCQIKTAKKAKRLGKSVGVSVAASFALQAVGAGVGVGLVSVPTPMWIVVTTIRVRIFSDRGLPGTCVGQLVFDAPRDLIVLTDRMVGGLLREVAILATETAEPIVRLNFGIRKNAADRIMQAA